MSAACVLGLLALSQQPGCQLLRDAGVVFCWQPQISQHNCHKPTDASLGTGDSPLTGLNSLPYAHFVLLNVGDNELLPYGCYYPAAFAGGICYNGY